MITLQTLAAGIADINRAYIEKPELDGDYPAMVVQYIISLFLIAQGGKADDFGFYGDPASVGFTGWITIGSETLYFAPTKAIISEDAPGDTEGELSPYGELP